MSRKIPLSGLQLIIAKMLCRNATATVDSATFAQSLCEALSCSGQGLVRASEGRLKEGSVYATLQRMQARGLVVSRREIPAENTSSSVIKRLYTLTPAGLAALAAQQGIVDAAQLRSEA